MKISTVTITLNSEKTIKQTIDSYLQQEYQDKELIVIDGGSTDDTINILESYKYCIDNYISEPDEGISDAFNKGILRSTGELVFILSSDDYLINSNIFDLVVAQTSKNVDIIYGDIISKSLNSERIVKPLSLKRIKYNFPLKHPAMFVKRSLYEKIGLYSLNCKMAMDYEFTYRAVNNDSIFKYIDKPLVVVRDGGANQQNRFKTIKEVYSVSTIFGANKFIAAMYVLKKILSYFIKILSDLNKHTK